MKDTKPKLIQDLGRLYSLKSKKGYDFGIYECACGEHYKTQHKTIETSKDPKCRKCIARVIKTKHNMCSHPLYDTWNGMMQRCYNHKNTNYKYYGSKNKIVSIEFHDVNTWIEYVESLENAYKETYTVDRIDNNGNYERGNLRWASKSTQSSNTINIRKNNTSGYRGVSYHKARKNYRARIAINGKEILIGTFKNAIDGAVAYNKYVTENNLEHNLNSL